MKPPFSYYGGKQKLAKEIIQLIPDHIIYCEPFAGGAAVFFGKKPSELEILNDTNKELINFYRVAQNDFVGLEKEIKISLHSRDYHRKAWVIYNNPDMFGEIKRAWAVYILTTQGIAGQISNSWGYDKTTSKHVKNINNRRQSFTEEYAIRLQLVQLECTDALRIINSRDSKDTFFYVDPPYYNSDCGHYDGYTIEDFEMLLKALSKITGKFILSSYPSELLMKYTDEFGWKRKEFEQTVTASVGKKNMKKKTEVLSANFELL
jgi:DNA adenine methylase